MLLTANFIFSFCFFGKTFCGSFYSPYLWSENLTVRFMINVHPTFSPPPYRLPCVNAWSPAGPSSPSSEKSAAPRSSQKSPRRMDLAKDSISISGVPSLATIRHHPPNEESSSFLVFSSPNLLQYEYLLPANAV